MFTEKTHSRWRYSAHFGHFNHCRHPCCLPWVDSKRLLSRLYYSEIRLRDPLLDHRTRYRRES
jgi:hypothetical protein